MDITDKFFSYLGASALQQSVYEPQADFFVSYTEQIYNMITLLLKSMNNKKNEYAQKFQQQGQSTIEKKTDDYEHEIQTTISLCSEKIKGIQQMVQQSKNKTEYAHKETVLSCLICELNKAIVAFKDFKLYRQRQKERLAQLTRISQMNKKETKIIRQNNENFEKVKNHDDPLFQENQQLIKRYNNEIKDIVTIQTQIRDIAASIQRMQEIVAHQEMLTEEILVHANESLQNIEKANKHLISSTKMNEQFGRRWGMLFFSMAIILLFYDYINALN